MYLKFNSKQSSTWKIPNEIVHLFKHLSSEKRNNQQTSLIIIASLANFSNCYSMVWACMQEMGGQQLYGLSFRKRWEKKLRVVLQCILGRDFLSLCTTIFSGIKNYPSASISCCSDDLAQLLPCLDLCSPKIY